MICGTQCKYILCNIHTEWSRRASSLFIGNKQIFTRSLSPHWSVTKCNLREKLKLRKLYLNMSKRKTNTNVTFFTNDSAAFPEYK